MNGAPQVLVVARYRDTESAKRVVDQLSAQSYGKTNLMFVGAVPTAESSITDDSLKIIGNAELANFLNVGSPDYVLFWPDEGQPKKAAVEKLVLALHLAPDLDGVADIEQASMGFWLARNSETTISLITLWHDSQIRWIEECQRRKTNLFFIPEHLFQTSDEMRHPYAVEHLFGKLPLRFETYQHVSTAPLWELPSAKAVERNVLLLVSNLRMGGATKFVLDVAEQLGSRGYRVTVATTGYDTEEPNPWLDTLLEITPDVFVLSHSRPVELPRLIVHLARARQCGRIVISHSMLGYQLLPWLRTELRDVTFLDYTHIEYETEQPNGGYALRSVNNQPLLDMSMVSSDHLRRWMIRKGADDAGLRVCHTNIDTDKWTPSAENRARDRDVLGAETKTAVILYPCRLVDQKRPELMCNIVSALRRATKEPFTVVVAGDGPLMPALKKFIESHGLKDSFQLLGSVTLDRVARLHNASDILLLPSLIEGIALALFEAMALESVPVVADVGGQRELVSPDCGYLIAPDETERELTDYVNALKRLIENPDERRQKGSASRKRVQDHFRLSQMTSTFIATMEEASIRRKERHVRLPDPSICREMATLAIDQIRLTREGSTVQEMVYILQDQAAKQERVAAKLRRQIETIRSIKPVQEENEVRY